MSAEAPHRGSHRDLDLGAQREEHVMIILGIILFVVGLIAKIPILETLGIILAVVGVVLLVLGSTGRAVGGRRHFY
jgi:uncharacterized membrane protein HdeD (DUF308 family)